MKEYIIGSVRKLKSDTIQNSTSKETLQTLKLVEVGQESSS